MSILSISPKIVIRGAGIIGLSIAWELLRHGMTPVIVDQGKREEKASWAAAGMLSAQFEALIEPEFSDVLHVLAARSVELWPEFARRLEAETGKALYHCSGPTLALLDPKVLNQFQTDRRLSGIETEVDLDRLESLVPGLFAPGMARILFPRDGQVDNRAVLDALLEVCRDHLTTDETHASSADILVDCLGWRAEGLRPVKGQMLSLKPDATHPLIPIRWGASYIVPKPDRTIIGATVEPDEISLTTDEARIDALLCSALDVLPDLARNLQITERWAGLRPMSRSQRPVIGWKDEGRLYLATGHYRNGILLAPATAERVVADLLGMACEGPTDITALRPVS